MTPENISELMMIRSSRDRRRAAFARGNKPVRLLGVGVRLLDLRGRQEQLVLFE